MSTTPFNIRSTGRKLVTLNKILQTIAGESVREIASGANLLITHESATASARELSNLAKLGHISVTPPIPKPAAAPRVKATDATAVELAALKEALDTLRREVITTNVKLEQAQAEIAALKKQPKPAEAPDPSVPPMPKPGPRR